jgi:hypothetical protein
LNLSVIGHAAGPPPPGAAAVDLPGLRPGARLRASGRKPGSGVDVFVRRPALPEGVGGCYGGLSPVAALRRVIAGLCLFVSGEAAACPLCGRAGLAGERNAAPVFRGGGFTDVSRGGERASLVVADKQGGRTAPRCGGVEAGAAGRRPASEKKANRVVCGVFFRSAPDHGEGLPRPL